MINRPEARNAVNVSIVVGDALEEVRTTTLMCGPVITGAGDVAFAPVPTSRRSRRENLYHLRHHGEGHRCITGTIFIDKPTSAGSVASALDDGAEPALAMTWWWPTSTPTVCRRSNAHRCR